MHSSFINSIIKSKIEVEMDLNDNNFLIVGLGKTGIETVRFLHQENSNVRATDYNKLDSLSEELNELIDLGIEIETGQHSTEWVDWADIIIVSPGVSFNIEIIGYARKNGKKIISEIEFAHYFISKPIIGITGTNGKTTTTSLISEILTNQGFNVFTGGNIGTPLVSIASNDDKYDYILLELSSFQLQGVINFRTYLAVILNISPNHLDHHDSYEEYTSAKFNLFKNQTEHEWAIFNIDDELINSESHKFKAKKISFGSASEADVKIENSKINYKDSSFDISRMKLLGKHNIENVMAAVAVSKTLDCHNNTIQSTIDNFNPLPHRIEYVTTINGVKVYNDSKSTTPNSTLKAIESLNSPLILLAGGKDKGTDYEILTKIINEKVKHLVLIGETKNKMREQLGKNINTTIANTLEDAVDSALTNSEPSDTLLFSPACSSFDMFKSYEERGRKFKEIVQNI